MKTLLLFVLLAPAVFAQQKQPLTSLQEDCGVTFAFTAASSGAQAAGTVISGSTGTTAVIDNRQAGCIDWLLVYSTTSTVVSLSLSFQTATDVAGNPGTWSGFGGTLNSGINPNTAATTPWAVTDATGTGYPFLRMNLTALGGTGTVQGRLYGWKRRPTYISTSGSSGCPGDISTPCVVIGPTAAGVAPTTAPVLIAGIDGTLVRVIHTDTAGNSIVVGTAADGAAVSGNPVRVAGKDNSGNAQDIATDTAGAIETVRPFTAVDALAGTNGAGFINSSGNLGFPGIFPYVFNGATWDRQFKCSLIATADLSGSGATQVIALSGTTIIRICSISLSTVAAEDIRVIAGTGTNCASSPTNLTGLYKSVQSFDFEYPANTTLNSTAGQAICVSQSVAQATGVTILYAQF